jgi:hypothetical protein
MFSLIQPTIALNDERLDSHAQMWQTQLIKANDSPEFIINTVAQAARSAPNGKVVNITIRCHGAPGYLQLGQGFDKSHTHLFGAWKGLVENIWITACEVAAMKHQSADNNGNGRVSERVGFLQDVAA